MFSLSFRVACVVAYFFLCVMPGLAAAPEHVIIFSNSSRNLEDFRAFARTVSRMKRYGRVQIDIGVLAAKAV